MKTQIILYNIITVNKNETITISLHQMTLQVSQIPQKGKKQYNCISTEPTYFQADVIGFLPPMQYEIHFQWSVSTNNELFSVVRYSSIDNTVVFTTLQPGIHHLKCEATLHEKRLPNSAAQEKQLPTFKIDAGSIKLETIFVITFDPPSQIQPPCCVPQNNCISPIYRVPPLQQEGARVRVMFQPDQPHQKTKFTSSDNLIPLPHEIQFTKTNAKKFTPPARQVRFTPWLSMSDKHELMVPLIGMLPGKIYQIKHQVLNGEKKLELKQKINYQTNQAENDFLINTVHVAEPSEKSYQLIIDNIQDIVFQQQKKQVVAQSCIVTPYNQVIVKINSQQQTGNQCQNSKKRIIGINKINLIIISSGVNDFCYSGNNCFEYYQQNVQQLTASLCASLQVNSQCQKTYIDQLIQICTMNAVPLTTIGVGYINQLLFKKYKQQLESDGQKFQYRPLIRFSHAQILEDNSFIITGQAEVNIEEYHVLQTFAQEYLSNQKEYVQLQTLQSSLLTGVLIHLSETFELLKICYLIDLFPTQLNYVDVVQLNTCQLNNNAELPGFITQNGYSIIHSQINQLDCTTDDVLLCCTRQQTILKFNLKNFSDHQQNNLNQPFDENFLKSDVIFYYGKHYTNHLAKLVQQVINSNLTPLSISRVSNRMYILVNNIVDESIEVIQLQIPLFLKHGSRDVQDILRETENENEEVEDPETSVSKSLEQPTQQETNDIVVQRRILLRQNMIAYDGKVIGLLKGGFVAAFRINCNEEWNLVEMCKSGDNCVFAEVINCPNLNIERII